MRLSGTDWADGGLTYDDTAAIVAFVFGGVITCAMGAIPWVTLKKLRELGAPGS